MIVRCLLLALSMLSLPAAAEELNQPLPCVSDDNFYPMGNRWVRDPSADRPEILMYHSAAGPTRTGNEQISQSLAEMLCRRLLPGRCAMYINETTQYSGECRAWTLLEKTVATRWWADNWFRLSIWFLGKVPMTRVSRRWNGGITVASYYRETGFVVDADIILNDRDYQWRVQQNGSNLGCSRTETGCYDIESVALHEAGHFFGLGHIRCGEAVMFPEGTGTGTTVGLSPHECRFCSLYPRGPWRHNHPILGKHTGDGIVPRVQAA